MHSFQNLYKIRDFFNSDHNSKFYPMLKADGQEKQSFNEFQQGSFVCTVCSLRSSEMTRLDLIPPLVSSACTCVCTVVRLLSFSELYRWIRVRRCPCVQYAWTGYDDTTSAAPTLSQGTRWTSSGTRSVSPACRECGADQLCSQTGMIRSSY